MHATNLHLRQNAAASQYPQQPHTAGCRMAIIGSAGQHVRDRIEIELASMGDELNAWGFDFRPVAGPSRIRHTVMADRTELLTGLRNIDSAYIATYHDQHPENILACAAAGVKRVFCEKPVADELSAAEALFHTLQARASACELYFIDSYRLLRPAVLLWSNTKLWLGEVSRVRISILEAKEIPAEQERVHRGGMLGLLHHALSLVALPGWFDDFNDWEIRDAHWAKHEAAPAAVPDTYRSLRVHSKRTGQLIVEAEVGKYMSESLKTVEIEGTAGKILWNRTTGELNMYDLDGLLIETFQRRSRDTGYGDLVRAIGCGQLPDVLRAMLLTPPTALEILRLLTEARHGTFARRLTSPPTKAQILLR